MVISLRSLRFLILAFCYYSGVGYFVLLRMQLFYFCRGGFFIKNKALPCFTTPMKTVPTKKISVKYQSSKAAPDASQNPGRNFYCPTLFPAPNQIAPSSQAPRSKVIQLPQFQPKRIMLIFWRPSECAPYHDCIGVVNALLTLMRTTTHFVAFHKQLVKVDPVLSAVEFVFLRLYRWPPRISIYQDATSVVWVYIFWSY